MTIAINDLAKNVESAEKILSDGTVQKVVMNFSHQEDVNLMIDYIKKNYEVSKYQSKTRSEPRGSPDANCLRHSITIYELTNKKMEPTPI